MTIAPYIKTIGRGHAGARPLDRAQAADLMGQVLDGQVTDLEIGAFCLAMRIKGETCDELIGFCQALSQRTLQLASDVPVVVIPSYNGARRLPNLTPLLALHLARLGARVLVHGPLRDPTRVTSAELFEALALPPCDSLAAVQAAWQRSEPAFVATSVLSPKLQRLLDVRWVVGLRNSGHTIAKLINPIAGADALCLASHTHPEFGRLMAEFAEGTHASMMLLRGTEGEAVADPRRASRMDVWVRGQREDGLSRPAQEGPLTALPNLPSTIDAASVAPYIRSVLAGDAPLPMPLQVQAELLLQTLQRIRSA
jgi:anthranilate phosphoribosyltransferase